MPNSDDNDFEQIRRKLLLIAGNPGLTAPEREYLDDIADEHLARIEGRIRPVNKDDLRKGLGDVG